MTDDWDEVTASTSPSAASPHAQPLPMTAGLVLGVVSAVVYPGLLMFWPFLWLIPGAIAGLLWAIRPARPLAAGFAAASAAWLTFSATLSLYAVLAG